MQRSNSDRIALISSPKRWLILSGIVLFLWAIWISGVFGNSGVLQAYHLAKARRDIALRITALKNEKQKMQTVLNQLEKDSFSQESAVRESLGWVRDQELVFEFR